MPRVSRCPNCGALIQALAPGQQRACAYCDAAVKSTYVAMQPPAMPPSPPPAYPSPYAQLAQPPFGVSPMAAPPPLAPGQAYPSFAAPVPQLRQRGVVQQAGLAVLVAGAVAMAGYRMSQSYGARTDHTEPAVAAVQVPTSAPSYEAMSKSIAKEQAAAPARPFAPASAGAEPPQPPVTRAARRASGMLPVAAIERVIRAHADRFEYCTSQAVGRTGHLDVRVTVAFTVDSAGTVEDATARGTDDASLRSCIEDEFRGGSLRFPSPKGGTADLSYTFHLSGP